MPWILRQIYSVIKVMLFKSAPQVIKMIYRHMLFQPAPSPPSPPPPPPPPLRVKTTFVHTEF
jgi:hypothetical protein